MINIRSRGPLPNNFCTLNSQDQILNYKWFKTFRELEEKQNTEMQTDEGWAIKLKKIKDNTSKYTLPFLLHYL